MSERFERLKPPKFQSNMFIESDELSPPNDLTFPLFWFANYNVSNQLNWHITCYSSCVRTSWIFKVRLYNKINIYPDVTLSREIAFRDPGCIQACTSDIHGPHKVEPTHLADCGGLNKALLDGEVHGGNDAAKSQAHKNTWEVKHGCKLRGSKTIITKLF